MRDLRTTATLALAIVMISAACGGGAAPAASSASGTLANPTAAAVSAVVTSAAPASVKPAAATDACALVSTSDMQAAFGALGPGPDPTAEPGSTAGGPPGMLNSSGCNYRFPGGGDVSVGLARFQDSATASGGLRSQVDMAHAQAPAASFRAISGLGDEATIYTAALPPPVGGQGAGLFVRKGSVVFFLFGGFSQGRGPADLGQAFEALARRVAAKV